MKKYILSMLLLLAVAGSSQTKLASHPLKLQKSVNFHQTVNAVNPKTKEIYVFAADRDDVTILRTNAALFFTDEFTVARPAREYFMAGYTFELAGKPIIYWATDAFEKIQAVSYDINTKTSANKGSVKTIKDEDPFASFTRDGGFYVLTRSESNDNTLLVHALKEAAYSRHELDFSKFRLRKANGVITEIGDLIQDYPPEYIDSREWQPLNIAAQPVKIYSPDQEIVITFDQYARTTQAFLISLSDFSIEERTFEKTDDDRRVTNSYLYKDRLYQLTANRDDLTFDVRDFGSGNKLKQYTAHKSDSITFKSSPLYVQTARRSAQRLKNTQKFLRKLNTTDVGISVYETPGYTLATIGGVKQVTDTGELMLGVGLGIGVALAGGDANIYIGNTFGGQDLQTVYFESLMDSSLQPADVTSQPLAVDHITSFLNTHTEAVLSRTFPYERYFILGYYDGVNDEYVLRKFEDGFYEPFSE